MKTKAELTNRNSEIHKRSSIMKHAIMIAVLAMTGSIMFAISNVQAAMILIPYANGVHLAGGESLSWDIPRSTEVTVDLRTAGDGGGSRYMRVKIDLRSISAAPKILMMALTPPGDIYSPASGTDLFLASGSGGGWDGTLEGITSAQFASGSASYPKNPINGWTANDGSGMLGEVVNWIMLKPPSGDAPAMPPGNLAVALGFIWEDKDNTGKVSAGDQVILKYAITADSFAEMNTVEKLEMFIIPEPATGIFLIGGLMLLTGRRRRR